MYKKTIETIIKELYTMLESMYIYNYDTKKDSYFYNKYLKRYVDALTSATNEQACQSYIDIKMAELKSKTIKKNVYTDSEGVTYNELV